MWLLTPFGFFSIVEKPDDRGTGMVTVRARVRGDIEALRARYLPEMSEIEGTPDRDYAWRGRVSREDLGHGLARIAQDITYANFETEVAQRMGYARELIYHDVYETLAALQQPRSDRLSQPDAPAQKEK
jgi:hypothetical protein